MEHDARRGRARFWATLVVMFTAAACGSAGCASDGNGAGGSRGSYIDQYQAGDYAGALRAADEAAQNARGPERDRAALVAGLAAHALNRTDEAERWLTPLANNADPQIAGRAAATLGLIAQSRGDHERAAGLLTSASPKLTGDEAARAAMHAGDSLMALNRTSQASVQYAIARASATTPEVKSLVAQRTTASGQFTIQTGAYSSRANAERNAAAVRATAARLGLGEPRIVTSSDRSGRQLFAVHIGSFPSKDAASSALSRMGGQGIVTRAR